MIWLWRDLIDRRVVVGGGGRSEFVQSVRSSGRVLAEVRSPSDSGCLGEEILQDRDNKIDLALLPAISDNKEVLRKLLGRTAIPDCVGSRI